MLETVQQRWEITSDADAKALATEFATAKASYSVNAGVTSKSMLSRAGWNSCRSGPEATWSKHTVTEEASASFNGKHACRRHYPDGSADPDRASSSAPSAFPVYQPGRLPYHPFRGLLSVHSRYGLHDRRVTYS